MTVSSNDPRRSYNGDGSTTAFATPYFLVNADIYVYVDGVLQTESTHYTLTGAGVAAGGTVTMLTAPPTGTANVIILNDPALTQGLNLVENDRNPAESREQAFDKLTMIAQRLRDLIERAFLLPDTVAGVSTVLPTPEASTFVGWDAAATALVNYAGISNVAATTFMATVLDDTSAQEARATLKAAGIHVSATRPAAADINAYDIWIDSDYGTGVVAVYLIVDPATSGLDAFRGVIDTANGKAYNTAYKQPSTITPATDTNVPVTEIQAAYGWLTLVDGAWTAGHQIQIPSGFKGEIFVDNSAGTYDAEVIIPSGLSVIVKAKTRRLVLANGTNIIDPLAATSVKGHLFGLTLSNGSDALHDIDIAAGEAADSTGTYLMELSAVMTKQLDAAWAVGSAAGGLFSGTVAANTWYHVFLIRKDSDGSIDAGFDTSASAANIPTGYSAYRRLGSVLTDGSSQIIAFTQRGDEFLWKTVVTDINAQVSSTTASSETLTVPTGVKVLANLVFKSEYSSASTLSMVNSLDQSETAGPYQLAVNAGSTQAGIQLLVRTNTSAQIRLKSSAAGANIYMYTHGWVDDRGRTE